MALRSMPEEAHSLLVTTSEFLATLVEGSHASSATDAALPKLFRALESLKQRFLEDGVSVAVLALAKSGKSTLINALLGDVVLPSNNVPETARITAVAHCAGAGAPRLTYTLPDGSPVAVDGSEAIREHLKQLNAAARDAAHSMVAGEQVLHIATPIAALAGSSGPTTAACAASAAAPAGTTGAEDTANGIADPAGTSASLPAAQRGPYAGGVTILDTPGPNEAGQDQLRYKVERLLEGVDAVVYLLDYTKLKTSEEAATLQRLHDINPALTRRLCRRLFFVVNKMDVAESCEGMDPEETREYVAALVTHQLGVPGFELQPEQVFLVSARDALRSRLVLRGGASQAELDAFRKVAFGKRWRSETDPDKIRDTAQEMLRESGLPELEAGVLGFLASRAALLHTVAILDDQERLLAQVHNLMRASAASLRQGVAALSAQVAALQGRLTDTLAQFEGVREEVSQLEGLVVDEVRDRMSRLRGRLADQITRVLTPNEPPIAAPHGRWPAVWSMAKAILGLGCGGSRSGAPSGALEGVDGEQELQMKLSELHSMIYLQIECEVKEFWHSLEQATNHRQRQLFAAINGRMAELSKAIEAEVACTLHLHCPLEPVAMRLQPPSAEQFHVSLQQLLKKGIVREVEQEREERTREHTVWQKREKWSLCEKYEYWEPVTETRSEAVTVERVSYRADVEGMRAYFLGVVDSSINNSVRAVRRYVHEYLADRLAEARSRLQVYADQFAGVMLEALDTARQGEAERAEALAVAESHCQECAGLLEQAQELQQQAEEMLEGWEEEEVQEEGGQAALGEENGLGTPGSDSYTSAASVDGYSSTHECFEPAGTAAASTLAALADLHSGRSSALGASSVLSTGSTAAEVAAAYAAQQVDELAAVAAGDEGASSLEARSAAGAVEEEDVLAEVAVHEDNATSPHQHASLAAAAGPAGSAASHSSFGDEDSDWTVVEEVEGEEDAPVEAATAAAAPDAADG